MASFESSLNHTTLEVWVETIKCVSFNAPTYLKLGPIINCYVLMWCTKTHDARYVNVLVVVHILHITEAVIIQYIWAWQR